MSESAILKRCKDEKGREYLTEHRAFREENSADSQLSSRILTAMVPDNHGNSREFKKMPGLEKSEFEKEIGVPLEDLRTKLWLKPNN